MKNLISFTVFKKKKEQQKDTPEFEEKFDLLKQLMDRPMEDTVPILCYYLGGVLLKIESEKRENVKKGMIDMIDSAMKKQERINKGENP